MRMDGNGGETYDILLVGGGHANIEVLRRLGGCAKKGDYRIALITNHPRSYYSGMIPGLISGLYEESSCFFSMDKICQHFGVDCIIAEVIAIRADDRECVCIGERIISFQVACINIGSTTRDTIVHERATIPMISSRPIATVSTAIQQVISTNPQHWLVVGGGAAGIEIAFAVRRIRPSDRITIIGSSPLPCHNLGASTSHKILHQFSLKGIVYLTGEVEEVIENEVRVRDGHTITVDCILLCTGASPHPLHHESDLQLSSQGFFSVNDHLQSISHPYIFAGGDCIDIEGQDIPKSGAISVRQGPHLYHNLMQYLLGKPLQRYYYPTHSLALLNTCDRSSILSYYGYSFQHCICHYIKDKIDVRFMHYYQGYEEE